MVYKLHKKVSNKATNVLIMIAVILAISAAILHTFAEKKLTRSIVRSNRAVVVDLGKESIVVGSLHNSSKKRVNVEKPPQETKDIDLEEFE